MRQKIRLTESQFRDIVHRTVDKILGNQKIQFIDEGPKTLRIVKNRGFFFDSLTSIFECKNKKFGDSIYYMLTEKFGRCCMIINDRQIGIFSPMFSIKQTEDSIILEKIMEYGEWTKEYRKRKREKRNALKVCPLQRFWGDDPTCAGCVNFKGNPMGGGACSTRRMTESQFMDLVNKSIKEVLSEDLNLSRLYGHEENPWLIPFDRAINRYYQKRGEQIRWKIISVDKDGQHFVIRVKYEYVYAGTDSSFLNTKDGEYSIWYNTKDGRVWNYSRSDDMYWEQKHCKKVITPKVMEIFTSEYLPKLQNGEEVRPSMKWQTIKGKPK